MDKPVIVIIGHTARDYVVTYPGIAKPAALGGAGLNAAAGACYWCQDGEVGIVTRVSESMPDELLGPVREHSGIDTCSLRVMKGEGIKLWILYDADGYRHWVIHHDSATREEASPSPDDIPQGYLETARGYHFAPLPAPNVLELLSVIPDGALVQIDPHYEWFLPEHEGLWKEILRRVTIVTPSEDEFTRFFGLEPGRSPAAYAPYLRRLSDMGPSIVILKLGKLGAMVYQREEDSFRLVSPIARDDEIVDFTGAGDSFCGGFLVSYASGLGVTESAKRGMKSSAITLGLRGVAEYFRWQ